MRGCAAKSWCCSGIPNRSWQTVIRCAPRLRELLDTLPVKGGGTGCQPLWPAAPRYLCAGAGDEEGTRMKHERYFLTTRPSVPIRPGSARARCPFGRNHGRRKFCCPCLCGSQLCALVAERWRGKGGRDRPDPQQDDEYIFVEVKEIGPARHRRRTDRCASDRASAPPRRNFAAACPPGLLTADALRCGAGRSGRPRQIIENAFGMN